MFRFTLSDFILAPSVWARVRTQNVRRPMGRTFFSPWLRAKPMHFRREPGGAALWQNLGTPMLIAFRGDSTTVATGAWLAFVPALQLRVSRTKPQNLGSRLREDKEVGSFLNVLHVWRLEAL